jgi:hypothetical protein
MNTLLSTKDRLALAEEVCYTVLVMMELDMLPSRWLPPEVREFLATPMQKWWEVAIDDHRDPGV